MHLTRAFLRLVAETATRLGLQPLAYRTLIRLRSFRHPATIAGNYRIRSSGAPDGLPLPPDYLIMLVAGGTSVRGFLSGGAQAAEAIRDILRETGNALDGFDRVLDFGCGCGRVLRQWQNLNGPEIHGVDYNPILVEWTQRALPFVSVRRGGLRPPLAYADDHFDFVYAFSVFTHLTEQGQFAWARELTRVLQSGGLLLVTMHGRAYLDLLTAEERERYNRGELVVTQQSAEGSNVCAAYNPPSFVRDQLFPDYEVLVYRETGGGGCGEQDAFLLRKR